MPPVKGRLKRAKPYPWERWFGNKRLRLLKGKHFECSIHGMAQQIRNAARKLGYKVSLRIDDTGIVIRSEQG